jgi:MFS superfamily sulfate permease-like transporter
MSEGLVLGIAGLAMTLVLLRSPRMPAMFALLALGAIVAAAADPSLLERIAGVQVGFRWPEVPRIAQDGATWMVALAFVVLPQLPLTLGNALVVVTEENNRLFPGRPASESKVALSTGAMNIAGGLLGGVPMCHGAGGLAAQVRFGARSGGAPLILGLTLLALGLFVGESVALMLELFPRPLLGVALFLTGLQLASGVGVMAAARQDRLVLLGTAGLSVWNVGLGFAFGLIAHALVRRRLLKL